MIGLVALMAGYLVGGIPTADWLAARRQLDLRAAGSGNPGANNALRLGGRALGTSVLAAELAKGASAVALGGWLAGDSGLALAGLGALYGNMYNPYRRLRGGQGLGIAAGILLASLPIPGVIGIAVAIVSITVSRRSAPAALAAAGTVVAATAVLPSGPWGVEQGTVRLLLAAGIAASILPKQLAKLRRRDPPAPPAAA